MKAIYAENPPISHADEAIDIIPSLDYIRDFGNNHTMSIRDLSIKTAFLLALVTASRPSYLKCIDLSSMQKTTSAITFDCIYLKKDLCLHPYNAIATLLDYTSDWRNFTEQRRSLFLITQDPHTLATSNTISGWIKSVVQKSSTTSSAKDMRVLSAFLLQNAGADMTTILALENWISSNVYQRFYQQGIKKMLERNQTLTCTV
ncbi:hypothetical protein RclHR1_08390013 [Rhizophagus clarus]|nr:hypothetical protein RclHR1_08390013 [Rhizophagus clarus]